MGRLRAALLALVLVLLAWGGGGLTPTGEGRLALGPARALAQASADAPLTEDDYAAWEKIASRAEESLANSAASDAAFEVLRADLASWRARFQVEQERGAGQIKTLEDQIDSLGPVPAEGETESPQITERRAELQAEFQAFITPVRKAEEAHARAGGLISRIDKLIRTRQKAQMLQRGPSPVAPGNVSAALDDLNKITRIVLAEISSAAHLKTDVTQFRNNLAQIVLLTGLSLLLLVRGRLWFKWLVDLTVKRGAGSDQAMVGAMVLSTGQVILPMIGVVLLTAALVSSSMFGPSGEKIVGTLPSIGWAFFSARWLGSQTFPRLERWPVALELTARERVRGRFYSAALGVLFGVAILVKAVIDLYPLKVGSAQVFAFPVIVLGAICLIGIARLLISHGSHTLSEGEAVTGTKMVIEAVDERSFVDRSMLLIGRACLAMAFAAPILSVAGFTRAAIFLALSPSLTLAILATVSFLQRLSMGLFRLISPSGRDPAEGLLPVLVNFAFLLGAMPFIAMVWGVRRADLDELWVQLQEGVMVGDTRVSPMVLLVLCLAFAAGLLTTRLVQAAMRASVLPRTGIDPGGQKAMISGIGYVGVFASVMIAVSMAGLDLSKLAIVAGALSVGVGFGLQNVVSNFVSGLILLIERPVTEGDWIEVGGVMGTVRKISVRATTVETFDRTDVVVPNSDFVSSQVTNWTRGNLSGRLILPVGVAYGTDTRRVAAILQEIAEAHPLVIVNPPPLIVFQGFGADSLDFEMRVILRDINFGLGTRSELNHQIAERFTAEGIEIPFAQRDIWLRNPEALGQGTRSAPADPGFLPPPPVADPDLPTEDDK